MLNVGQKQQFFKEYELFGIFKRGTSFKYNILSGISFFSPAVCSMLRAKHQYELSAIFRGTTPSNRKVFASLPLPNRTLLILPCIQPCFILDTIMYPLRCWLRPVGDSFRPLRGKPKHLGDWLGPPRG